MRDAAPERPAASGMVGAGGAAIAQSDHLLDPTAADALLTGGGAPGDAFGLEAERIGGARMAWRKFRRHKLAMASLVVLLLIALAVVFSGVLATHGENELSIAEQLQSPNGDHLLGTDSLGRDNFSRILYGGRASLVVGLGVAVISTIIGTVIGSIAGYYGGWIDNVTMRVTDLFLSIPLIVLLILGGKLLGGSILDIVIVLSLFLWMPLARIIRGVILSLKEKEFVEAARSIGASDRRIIFRHVLPNTLGPIIVNATLNVATAIILESTISFLGYGIQAPNATWGNLLQASRDQLLFAEWLVIYPGLAILLTVLCVNFLGDGLRDALDPTQRRVRA